MGWIDRVFSNAYCAGVKTTLTIRKLGAAVKQKLRKRAARNQRSMEAEARAILTAAVSGAESGSRGRDAPDRKGKFDHLVGIWKGRLTTDELMKLTRGDA
jgi:plasmid stability protein